MGCSGNAEQNAGLKFGRSPDKQNGQVMNLERRTTRRGSIENEEGTQQAFRPTQQKAHRTENHAPRGIIFFIKLGKVFQNFQMLPWIKKNGQTRRFLLLSAQNGDR